jgi:hypothetical protein
VETCVPCWISRGSFPVGTSKSCYRGGSGSVKYRWNANVWFCVCLGIDVMKVFLKFQGFCKTGLKVLLVWVKCSMT